MALSKKERFELFITKLNDASIAETAIEAFRLVEKTLNEIEDNYSGVPYCPDDYLDDGRMYPPQADAARVVIGRDDVTRYRNRGHNTYIGANGAIRISTVPDGLVIIDKVGCDNRLID